MGGGHAPWSTTPQVEESVTMLLQKLKKLPDAGSPRPWDRRGGGDESVAAEGGRAGRGTQSDAAGAVGDAGVAGTPCLPPSPGLPFLPRLRLPCLRASGDHLRLPARPPGLPPQAWATANRRARPRRRPPLRLRPKSRRVVCALVCET